MSTWQEDIREGFRLLDKAIHVAMEAEETRAEIYPGQVRGLIRLVLVSQRRGMGSRKFIYPSARVKVFDELDRVTREGEVIKLWCPYGFEMAQVRLEEGEDWFPVVDCIVTEGP